MEKRWQGSHKKVRLNDGLELDMRREKKGGGNSVARTSGGRISHLIPEKREGG